MSINSKYLSIYTNTNNLSRKVRDSATDGRKERKAIIYILYFAVVGLNLAFSINSLMLSIHLWLAASVPGVVAVRQRFRSAGHCQGIALQ